MNTNRSLELFSRVKEVSAALEPKFSVAPFPNLPHAFGFEARDGFLSAAQVHTRELTNFINEYTLHLDALCAWDDLLPQLSDEERFDAIVEFVHPSAYLCLGFPHRLEGRAHHALAHVSHLANEFVDDDWHLIDDLGKSEYRKAKLHSKTWPGWPDVRRALRKVNNARFKRSTADFRNEYEHGLPRCLEVGIQPFVKRIRTEDGGTMTVVGASPPLKLVDLLPALIDQHSAALELHRTFVALVEQQLAATGFDG